MVSPLTLPSQLVVLRPPWVLVTLLYFLLLIVLLA
jgi:hypothetical protein